MLGKRCIIKGHSSFWTVVGVIAEYAKRNPFLSSEEINRLFHAEEVFPGNKSFFCKTDKEPERRDKYGHSNYVKLADGEFAIVYIWHKFRFNAFRKSCKALGTEYTRKGILRPGMSGWYEVQFEKEESKKDDNKENNKSKKETSSSQGSNNGCLDMLLKPFKWLYSFLSKLVNLVLELLENVFNAIVYLIGIIWKPLLVVLVILLILYLLSLLRGCSNESEQYPDNSPKTESSEQSSGSVEVDTVQPDKISTPDKSVDDICCEKTISALKAKSFVLLFEVSKSDISNDGLVAINCILNYLKKNPDLKIRIDGHASVDGPDWLNKKLSSQRARAVYEHMITSGISKDRVLSYKGHGSKCSTGISPESDRRVEIMIVK